MKKLTKTLLTATLILACRSAPMPPAKPSPPPSPA